MSNSYADDGHDGDDGQPPHMDNNEAETDVRVAAITKLDEQSSSLQEQGMLMEALQLMERSLILRGSVYGLQSQIVYDACYTVASMCNYLAMLYLSHSDTAGEPSASHTDNPCLTLLNKAEVLSEQNVVMRCITYNNYSCYYRRNNKLRIALKYALKCIELETKLTAHQADINFSSSSTLATNQSMPVYHQQAVSSADTHLNVCTILSELKRYSEAMQHAKTALRLLLIELFGNGSNNSAVAADTEGGDENGEASEPTESAQPAATKQELPADRVGVLAIAYHNLAVQQEQLHQYADALQSYSKAVSVSTTHLGASHSLAKQMKASHKAAHEKFAHKCKPVQHRVQLKDSLKNSQTSRTIPNLAKTVNQLNMSLSQATLAG